MFIFIAAVERRFSQRQMARDNGRDFLAKKFPVQMFDVLFEYERKKYEDAYGWIQKYEQIRQHNFDNNEIFSRRRVERRQKEADYPRKAEYEAHLYVKFDVLIAGDFLPRYASQIVALCAFAHAYIINCQHVEQRIADDYDGYGQAEKKQVSFAVAYPTSFAGHD